MIFRRLHQIILLQFLLAFASLVVPSVSQYSGAPYVTRAVAIMNIGTGGAQGQVSFVQNFYGGPINVQGTITGLAPGQHGFHIHQLGNLTDMCTSAAGHFNPYLLNHGSPTAVVRHVGDLGNIVADGSGTSTIQVIDNQLQLNGVSSIIGRAAVVHQNPDDLGLGNTTESLTTGSAGGRVVCGVIGIAEERLLYPSYG